MLYPTIDQLTKDEFNRYELALATARCARKLTDEYVEQRAAVENAPAENKEANRSIILAINKEYREEKAVKNAITKIYNGTYRIVRTEPASETSEQSADEAAE